MAQVKEGESSLLTPDHQKLVPKNKENDEDDSSDEEFFDAQPFESNQDKKAEENSASSSNPCERMSEDSPADRLKEDNVLKDENKSTNSNMSDEANGAHEIELDRHVDDISEHLENVDLAGDHIDVAPLRTHEYSATESFLTDESKEAIETGPDENEREEEKEAETPIDLDEDGEEALKELEDTLTEEQKLARKDEAQNLKSEGNQFFKNEEFADAVFQYTEALRTCPLCFKKERAIMFANRAACKVHLKQTEDAIKDCTKAIDLHPHYLKVILRRAQTYEALEKLEEALKDYQRALELDPGCHMAREASMRLPDEIKERNEKLKEEMIGKLKDLGNLVLRPFGLSTNNFQMQQDPSTGSYSVNFVQNQKPTNGK